jgi:hypothetical protein
VCAHVAIPAPNRHQRRKGGKKGKKKKKKGAKEKIRNVHQQRERQVEFKEKHKIVLRFAAAGARQKKLLAHDDVGGMHDKKQMMQSLT